ncbi:MAG TPA: hypothetical protein VMW76_07325 [Bacteroidales bacterium]|nr:hypothetical protein [Bacteroidales bacterium]
MKTYLYILLLTIFILSACSSSIYMSGEYDDLYYTPSDKQMYVQEYPANQDAYQSITEIENQYNLDTLIGDEYFDPSIYDDDLAYYDTDRNSAFDYYSGGSYSRNLNRFYGNYFDPYWRYPYYGFGYNSFSYGFGYPYYNPFSYYGGYGGYGGYYDFYDPYYSYYSYPYYRNSYHWGGYSPYYGYYSPYTYSRVTDNTEIQRRRSYSTLSNNYNRNVGSKATSLPTYGSRRNAEALSSTNSATRRIASGSTVSNNAAANNRAINNDRALQSVQNQNIRRTDQNVTSTRTSDKPVYNSADRTYIPTYTNPRMSTRPTYNTTVTKRNTSTGTNNRTINNTSTNRGAVTNRSGNSRNSIINRSANSSSRSNYSTPIRSNNTSISRSSSFNSSRSVSSGSAVRSTSSSSSRSSGSSSSGGRSTSSSSSSSGRRR